ncbi:MAG: DUF4178 domain-containing protein [Syntrophaceae bacterium]|nr:DUF4178 domain-containing protein [Syntrophaceae bacterium]
MKKEVPCPSCGAPVVFQSAASILAVCEYCSSTLVRHDLDLENVGKMAQLQADGSPLQLRAEGRYRGVPFTVVGRIQLRFEKGLWNEWHLLFDDQRSGWLGEAEGNYAVSFLGEIKEGIPKFEELHPGRSVSLQDAVYEVTNMERAFCIGGEGELPFRLGPGYEAPVADLTGPGKRFATLDYSEDPPLVYLGEYVDFEELHLSGLREFDGW